MSLSYEIFSLEDACKKGLIDWEPYNADYRSAIFRIEDGTYTLVGVDGGEPEDASFRRDYDWVLRELNYAATKGRV